MFGVDVDQFRVLKPWRDWSFWLAVLASMPGLATVVHDGWLSRTLDTAQVIAAVGPVSAWLAGHGVVRARAASALGNAVGYAALAQNAPADDEAEGEEG